MQLEHIAITVNDSSEIPSFYKQILGMNEIKNFKIDKLLAGKIWGIKRETKVYLLNIDQLFLEIFVDNKKYSQRFNHICLKINNRELMIKKALANHYECIQIEREKSDLVFIKDKSGNIFEIKNND